MSKYRPLQDYLRQQNGQRIELSFPEIESIIGGELPPSACRPRWWISCRSSRRHALWQDAWQNAGYVATLLRGADRVEFRKQL